jgi:hypothetical protein
MVPLGYCLTHKSTASLDNGEAAFAYGALFALVKTTEACTAPVRILLIQPYCLCALQHLLQVRRPVQGGQPGILPHSAHQPEAQEFHLPHEV